MNTLSVLFVSAAVMVSGSTLADAKIPICAADAASRIATARAILGEPQESLMTQRDREAIYCLLDILAQASADVKERSDDQSSLTNGSDARQDDGSVTRPYLGKSDEESIAR